MALPAQLFGIRGPLLATVVSVFVGGVGCGGSMAPSSEEAGRGGSTTGSGGATATIGAGGATGVFGFGGATAAGGNTYVIDCTNTACPSLPVNCTEFVQPAGDCCAQCVAGNACPPCPVPLCAAGFHSETLAGNCCPQCVVNAPTACEDGQAYYKAIRGQLIDRYSLISCNSSSECTIAAENNACAWTCGNPIVTNMSDSFKSNLDLLATRPCASCAAPTPVLCEQMVPACVNGKCVAANPR